MASSLNGASLRDKCPEMIGMLSIAVRNASGLLVPEFSERNLIVAASKDLLAKLVAGDAEGHSVGKVALGTDDSAADLADTTIGGVATTSLSAGINLSGGTPVAFLTNISGHSYPASGQVTFQFTIGYGEANGLTICEFGLLAGDQQMFARKVRGGIPKESDLSIEGAWTLIF